MEVLWRWARGLTADRAGKFSVTEILDGSHAQAAVRVSFSSVRPVSIVQSSASFHRVYRGAGRRRNLMERWPVYLANEASDTVVPMERPTGGTGPRAVGAIRHQKRVRSSQRNRLRLLASRGCTDPK